MRPGAQLYLIGSKMAALIAKADEIVKHNPDLAINNQDDDVFVVGTEAVLKLRRIGMENDRESLDYAILDAKDRQLMIEGLKDLMGDLEDIEEGPTNGPYCPIIARVIQELL